MNKRVIKWILKHHIDVKNKNILITGSNSGIGFDTAVILSSLGANVYMCVRNLKKGQEAKEKILKIYPEANISILEVDLASFESIDRFIDTIVNNHLDIDGFINNAGIFNINNQKTKEGYELVFGTNYIGTYHLTEKLIPYLKTLNHEVKYVFEGSLASYFAPRNVFHSKHTYSSSKFAISCYWYYLAINNSNSNIKFLMSHPGITYTNLIDKAYKSNAFVKLARLFMKVFFHSSLYGALPTINQFEEGIANMTYIGPRFIHYRGLPKKYKVQRRVIKEYRDIVSKTCNL